MSLMCALGLAACLSFQDASFKAEDAAAIEEDCMEMARAEPRSFATPPAPSSDQQVLDSLKYELAYFKGYSLAQAATDLGLQLDWSVAPEWRRTSWLRTCSAFNAAYYDNSKWTHLEKWPWK